MQTKKKRSSRRQAEDSGIEPTSADGMDVDVKPLVPVRNLDANFVDDDDLQASLARARRAKTMRKPARTAGAPTSGRLGERSQDSVPNIFKGASRTTRSNRTACNVRLRAELW